MPSECQSVRVQLHACSRDNKKDGLVREDWEAPKQEKRALH